MTRACGVFVAIGFLLGVTDEYPAADLLDPEWCVVGRDLLVLKRPRRMDLLELAVEHVDGASPEVGCVKHLPFLGLSKSQSLVHGPAGWGWHFRFVDGDEGLGEADRRAPAGDRA